MKPLINIVTVCVLLGNTPFLGAVKCHSLADFKSDPPTQPSLNETLNTQQERERKSVYEKLLQKTSHGQLAERRRKLETEISKLHWNRSTIEAQALFDTKKEELEGLKKACESLEQESWNKACQECPVGGISGIEEKMKRHHASLESNVEDRMLQLDQKLEQTIEEGRKKLDSQMAESDKKLEEWSDDQRRQREEEHKKKMVLKDQEYQELLSQQHEQEPREQEEEKRDAGPTIQAQIPNDSPKESDEQSLSLNGRWLGGVLFFGILIGGFIYYKYYYKYNQKAIKNKSVPDKSSTERVSRPNQEKRWHS